MPLNVHRGKKKGPRKIAIYGVPGVGKTTWASQCPGVVFIPTEDGIDDLDVASFPQCQSFDAAEQCLKDLASEDHEFTAIVIDSADWLERLIWSKLCQEHNVPSIQSVGGGFGKGYAQAANLFSRFLRGLDYLKETKGMTSILTAHARTERFEDPETDSYDRYVPKLHASCSDLLVEWSYEVLFANYKTFTKQEEGSFGRTTTKAIGDGQRFLRTTAKPYAVAKNRLGMPDEIEMTWQAYAGFLS